MRMNDQRREEFVSAARTGDLAVVRRYLEEGADPDTLNKQGLSALVEATLHPHIEVMVALLDAGAKPSLLTKSSSSGLHLTALHRACNSCHEESIDLLLDRGASSRVRDQNGQTPAHSLVEQWPKLTMWSDFEREVSDENFVRLKLARMFEQGLPVNQPDDFGQTLLGLAIDHGAPISLLNWMKDQGASLLRCGKQGKSALHLAVRMQDIELMRLAVSEGVHIDTPDDFGRSPLFEDWATQEIADELLHLGANIEHQDINGRTALAHVLSESTLVAPPKAAVLLNAGASVVSADFEGMTPREIAVKCKLVGFVPLMDAAAARSAIRAAVKRPPSAP